LIYSDLAIETLNIIRFKVGLKLRCTQGLAQSLAQLMHLNIKIPNYTTFCRQLKKLSSQIHSTTLASSLNEYELILYIFKLESRETVSQGIWQAVFLIFAHQNLL